MSARDFYFLIKMFHTVQRTWNVNYRRCVSRKSKVRSKMHTRAWYIDVYSNLVARYLIIEIQRGSHGMNTEQDSCLLSADSIYCPHDCAKCRPFSRSTRPARPGSLGQISWSGIRYHRTIPSDGSSVQDIVGNTFPWNLSCEYFQHNHAEAVYVTCERRPDIHEYLLYLVRAL